VNVYIDGHVHIYDFFDLDDFFDTALQNFKAISKQDDQQSRFFLLLSESKGCNWFRRLSNQENGEITALGNWQVNSTPEKFVLQMSRTGEDGGCIYLIAGRQIVTREKLEVLSLFSAADISEGMPLVDTIQQISEKNGLAVLPWGAGKWLGSRGKVLRRLRAEEKKGFLWGDNGGRPSWWPTPDLLRSAGKNGIGILSGSDPLPLSAELNRVASFGSIIHCELADDTPGESLKATLQKDVADIIPFGRKANNCSFLQNQLQLYMNKKRS